MRSRLLSGVIGAWTLIVGCRARPPEPFRSAGASYNSFRHQTGFCMMQGYDTVSRVTSGAPAMFLDGRVTVGVGLSDAQFRSSTASCGACILVESVANFGLFNPDLTGWNGTGTAGGFMAVVMDQCTDPVCTPGWLDFDIYSPLQPVARGNPIDLVWSFVPCPVLPGESIELLFCTSASCHPEHAEGRTFGEVLDASEPAYWLLYVRNARVPVTRITLEGHGPLLDRNGWLFAGGGGSGWGAAVRLVLEPGALAVTLHLEGLRSSPTTPGYRGGTILRTGVQN